MISDLHQGPAAGTNTDRLPRPVEGCGTLNRMVENWRRHREKATYEGPDGFEIDGETYKFTEEAEMPAEVALDKQQMADLVRYVKRSPLTRVTQLRNATYKTLKRLGVKRDKTKAAVGMPKGSDQGNLGNIIHWLNKVTASDRKATRQVVKLDATAVARTEG